MVLRLFFLFIRLSAQQVTSWIIFIIFVFDSSLQTAYMELIMSYCNFQIMHLDNNQNARSEITFMYIEFIFPFLIW